MRLGDAEAALRDAIDHVDSLMMSKVMAALSDLPPSGSVVKEGHAKSPPSTNPV
jgi:hypothetical protein